MPELIGKAIQPGSERPPGRVRLVPNLSAAAFREKQSKELTVWYCLRAINHWGSGVIDKGRAISGLIDYFGYSLPTAYRHLILGEGHFWQTENVTGRCVLAIYSLDKVCQHLLGVRRPLFDKHFRDLSYQEFNATAKRKAQIYASILKPQSIKGNPISRAAIQGISVVSKQGSGLHERP